MGNPLTFDLGDYTVTHPDEVCWTVSKKCCTAIRGTKPGKPYLRAISHHGTLEDAIQNVVRLLAAGKVPGGGVSSVTIWRWAKEGLASESGSRVRLRYAAAGKRMLTSEAWMREFFEALAQ